MAITSRPGAGTTFRVLFPRAAHSALEPVLPETKRSDWRGGGRLLVVDDEAVVRMVLVNILERAGFEVTTACDGREGVDVFAAADGEFDLVLLDLTMPNLSGEEALRELRRIRSGVPVLLCSGFSHDGLAGRLKSHGVDGFLKKPFRSADVIDKVSAILESAPSR